MSESLVFPYGIALREDREVDIFPAAEVFLRNRQDEEISLFLIIDSGAKISALPRKDAKELGIEVQAGVPISVSGIEGGAIKGWRHELPARLGRNKLRLPFVFLDSDKAPSILGREGIFENFTLVFEEAKRRSGFLKKNSREAAKMGQILDRLTKAK